MALPLAIQIRYWGVAALGLALALWALGDVILPFVLGAALAYFLNPVVNALERLGLGRVTATVAISIMALMALALVLALLVPALIGQAVELAEAAPGFLATLQAALAERFPALADGSALPDGMIEDLGTWAQARGGEVLGRLLSSFRSFVTLLLLLVVVPVVCVYLLIDWHRLIARIDALLPREHAPTIRQLAHDMDRAIAAFIRGMGSVCLIMSAYYGIALMAVGLQFGLIVGVVAGILTFIPYVGAVLGGILAIGLGLFQFWGDWFSVALVAGVFLAGQAVEGNLITPRIVGRSVGLHPVWVLFAIAVFGSLFGFVGLLVAVPLAAAAGVLIRHGVALYQQSPLFQAETASDAPADTGNRDD